jgi:hypothetical protein
MCMSALRLSNGHNLDACRFYLDSSTSGFSVGACVVGPLMAILCVCCMRCFFALIAHCFGCLILPCLECISPLISADSHKYNMSLLLMQMCRRKLEFSSGLFSALTRTVRLYVLNLKSRDIKCFILILTSRI